MLLSPKSLSANALLSRRPIPFQPDFRLDCLIKPVRTKEPKLSLQLLSFKNTSPSLKDSIKDATISRHMNFPEISPTASQNLSFKVSQYNSATSAVSQQNSQHIQVLTQSTLSNTKSTDAKRLGRVQSDAIHIVEQVIMQMELGHVFGNYRSLSAYSHDIERGKASTSILRLSLKSEYKATETRSSFGCLQQGCVERQL